MFEIFTYISFALAGFVLLYSFIFQNKISRFIKVDELGIIEKDLVGLVQVVVVANEVERPTSTLQEAVEANFGEGVKYLFLISNSRADKALNGYYKIFKALAEISISNKDEDFDIKSLVEIKRLPYDWPDVPYIFYQFIKEDSDERHTVAFRGNQKGEGVANYYEQLPLSHSKAIVMALLAEAPSEIKKNLTFTDKVVTFSRKTA